MKPSTPPPNGVHIDVPMDEYHTWDAASNTRLNRLKRSPAHLKAYLDEPPPDTAALRLGRATHAAVLEPDLFAERYVCGPPGDRRKKEVKEAWAEIEAQYSPEYILKPDEYDACIAMRNSVRRRMSAAGLLGGQGDCELSVVWKDAATGVTCKARADRVSYDLAGGTIVDLKTTTDASRLNFERAIFSLGYYRQAALYLNGFNAAGRSVRHFTIIAVEKTPPYEVGVYRLTEGALEAGEDEIKELLKKYRECVETDEWPGYPDEIQDIALPSWAWNRIEDERQVAI